MAKQNRSKALVQRVMEAGEAQIDKVVNQLLTNESFVAAVQGVVSKSLAAKGSIDKSLRSALSTMNLPSSADIEELRTRLDRLDRVLSEVDEKLARLEREGGAAKKKAASLAASGGAKPKKAGSEAAAKKPAAKKASAKKPSGN